MTPDFDRSIKELMSSAKSKYAVRSVSEEVAQNHQRQGNAAGEYGPAHFRTG